MIWQPHGELQKGETVGFVLRLTPQTKAVVVFHQPDGYWYASVTVGNRRVTAHVKAKNERDAKTRAIEQVRTFARSLTAALDELELVGEES